MAHGWWSFMRHGKDSVHYSYQYALTDFTAREVSMSVTQETGSRDVYVRYTPTHDRSCLARRVAGHSSTSNGYHLSSVLNKVVIAGAGTARVWLPSGAINVSARHQLCTIPHRDIVRLSMRPCLGKRRPRPCQAL